jgi:hypothetical protein
MDRVLACLIVIGRTVSQTVLQAIGKIGRGSSQLYNLTTEDE